MDRQVDNKAVLIAICTQLLEDPLLKEKLCHNCCLPLKELRLFLRNFVCELLAEKYNMAWDGLAFGRRVDIVMCVVVVGLVVALTTGALMVHLHLTLRLTHVEFVPD